VVWVAAGSEDHWFFADRAVQAVFLKHGYQVKDVAVGSLDMASPSFSPGRYGLLVPSSTVIADQVAQQLGTCSRAKIDAFSTPLVALTWQPLVQGLINADLATKNADGTYTFHLGAYLNATRRKLLWSDIVPVTVFNQRSLFLAQFSDPRRSNSGAMVLAAASWVLNNPGNIGENGPVAGQLAIGEVAPQLRDLLMSMGYLVPTSDLVIDNYLNYHMYGAPLVFTYESEFIDRVVPDESVLQESGVPKPVIMYLDPTVGSDRTLLPRTDAARRWRTCWARNR
jgi:hypothetical protein